MSEKLTEKQKRRILIDKHKKKLVDEQKTISQLHKMSLEISEKCMRYYPNTFPSKLKTRVGYLAVIELINEMR